MDEMKKAYRGEKKKGDTSGKRKGKNRRSESDLKWH